MARPTAAPPSPPAKAGLPGREPSPAAHPARAFAQVEATAKALGWQISAAVPAEGRLEATDTTRWFRFKDDIVVRVAPALDGSRVDVRSVSRIGRSDLGANAIRIRAFLSRSPPASRPDPHDQGEAMTDHSTTIVYESGEWRRHDNYFGGEPYGAVPSAPKSDGVRGDAYFSSPE